MITNFRHSLHFTVNGVAKGLMERLQQTPERAQLFEQMHNGEEAAPVVTQPAASAMSVLPTSPVAAF